VTIMERRPYVSRVPWNGKHQLVGPWDCRSGDCDELATYYAEIPGGSENKGKGWDGHFCQAHLLRALELKLLELGRDAVQIWRIQ